MSGDVSVQTKHALRRRHKAERRLKREAKTAALMIEKYCRCHHAAPVPCQSCSELLLFVAKRLERCPYQEAKPPCSHCSIHCYQGAPEMRERIREIMRYAGPRMLFSHPILSVLHLYDGIKAGKSNAKKPSEALRQHGKE